MVLAEAEGCGNLEWDTKACVEPCKCVAGLWDSLCEKQWWGLLVRAGTMCIITSPWTATAWSEFCFWFSGDSNLAVSTPVLSAKRLFTVSVYPHLFFFHPGLLSLLHFEASDLHPSFRNLKASISQRPLQMDCWDYSWIAHKHFGFILAQLSMPCLCPQSHF